MDAYINEWVNLFIRWFHLIAGIAWIGSSFFFMWLDSHLEQPSSSKKDVEGELWMVHSGGFYQVEKKLIESKNMPKVLHWFKWEATLTWISGFCLLVVVYYLRDGVYLIDPSISDISVQSATILGLATLFVSWVLYDLLWVSYLSKYKAICNFICTLYVVGLCYGLSQYLSGRAAFIHIGAMFGTLMVANVWMRILPAQREMIAATKEDRTPDYSLGKKAKQRSIHNNYMTFPVLFIMLSNHFPSTYGHSLSWVTLLGIMLAGAGVRHFMNVRNQFSGLVLVSSIVIFLGMFFMTAPLPSKKDNVVVSELAKQGYHHVSSKGCFTCHSVDGAKTIGPTFKGIWGRVEELTNGEKFIVDANYIRESIEYPKKKFVKGYPPVMPVYKGQFTDSELEAIVEYFKSLK